MACGKRVGAGSTTGPAKFICWLGNTECIAALPSGSDASQGKAPPANKCWCCRTSLRGVLPKGGNLAENADEQQHVALRGSRLCPPDKVTASWGDLCNWWFLPCLSYKNSVVNYKAGVGESAQPEVPQKTGVPCIASCLGSRAAHACFGACREGLGCCWNCLGGGKLGLFPGLEVTWKDLCQIKDLAVQRLWLIGSLGSHSWNNGNWRQVFDCESPCMGSPHCPPS